MNLSMSAKADIPPKPDIPPNYFLGLIAYIPVALGARNCVPHIFSVLWLMFPASEGSN